MVIPTTLKFDYLKFTNVKNIPKSILVAFLFSFRILSADEIKTKSVTELRKYLLESETKRRPSSGFSIYVAKEKNLKTNFFTNSDFDKATATSARGVNQPKKVKTGPNFQFRCLIVSLNLLSEFFENGNKFSSDYIEKTFKLEQSPVDFFEFFCPIDLVQRNFLEFSQKGFKKLKPLTESLKESLFGKKATGPINKNQVTEQQDSMIQESDDEGPGPVQVPNSVPVSTSAPVPSPAPVSSSVSVPSPVPSPILGPTQPQQVFQPEQVIQPQQLFQPQQVIQPQQVVPPQQVNFPQQGIQTQQVTQPPNQIHTEPYKRPVSSQAHYFPNTNEMYMNQVPFDFHKMARKGFLQNTDVSLKDLWDPNDTKISSNYKEIESTLRFVKKRRQYMNDEALILKFLSDNSQQRLMFRMSEKEQTDLDSFIKWLKKFKKERKDHLIQKFRNFKQGDKSLRVFASDLENLYRAYNDLGPEDPISEVGHVELKITFINNMKDKRIAQSLQKERQTENFFVLVDSAENLYPFFEEQDEAQSTPVTSRINLVAPEENLIIKHMESLMKSFKADSDAKHESLQRQFDQMSTKNNQSNQARGHPHRNFESQGQKRNQGRFDRNRNQGSSRNFEVYCYPCDSRSHSQNQCREAHQTEMLNGRKFCTFCKKSNHNRFECFKNPENQNRGQSQFQHYRNRNPVHLSHAEPQQTDLFSEN